jgi:predicted MFS family arabinose efflux permease
VPADRNNPEAMRALIAAMPVGAFLMILLAYAAGTFVGGAVAGRVARSRAWRYAGSIGGLILVFALLNILMLPHPLWFTVAVIVVIPLAALLARAVGVPKPSA